MFKMMRGHTGRVEIVVLDNLGSFALQFLDGVVSVFVRSAFLEGDHDCIVSRNTQSIPPSGVDSD